MSRRLHRGSGGRVPTAPAQNTKSLPSALRNLLARNLLSGGGGPQSHGGPSSPGSGSTSLNGNGTASPTSQGNSGNPPGGTSSGIYIAPNTPLPNTFLTGSSGGGKSFTLITQRISDLDTSPRDLNPTAFLWGSPDHLRVCGSNFGTMNNNAEYGAIIPPEADADLWMFCEILLTSKTSLGTALLEDLLDMPASLRDRILEQSRLDAIGASSVSTAKALGPLRGDYLDAFTAMVSSLPLGSFPATERVVMGMYMERNSTGELEKYTPISNSLWSGMPLGNPMNPKFLGDEIQRHIRLMLAGWMIQSHYYFMSPSYTTEERGKFLKERRARAAASYLSNLRAVTRQLSNLADIAQLPFNQEQGTWSSYLDSRIDPLEWDKAGYSSVEEISAMAKDLHGFMVQCSEAGVQDDSLLLALYMAQSHLSLPRLLELAALTEEYNLEWAVAAIDWA